MKVTLESQSGPSLVSHTEVQIITIINLLIIIKYLNIYLILIK